MPTRQCLPSQVWWYSACRSPGRVVREVLPSVTLGLLFHSEAESMEILSGDCWVDFFFKYLKVLSEPNFSHHQHRS